MEPAAALPPGRYRGVVFDLDGTLVDSFGAIARSVNRARSAFGLSPMGEPDVRRIVGRGLESLMADVVGPDRVEEGVKLFREHYARVFADETTALPGAEETVRTLHGRGYRLAVASNKPARFGAPILERLGMLPYVRAVEGPDTAGATKPDPAILGACLRGMGVRPAETLYVGDMVLDVETADRAGIDVVLVPGGASGAEELRETGRAVLESIVDLLELLPALGDGHEGG